jgi:hypothetical protein
MIGRCVLLGSIIRIWCRRGRSRCLGWQRAGLLELADRHLSVAGGAGVAAGAKVGSLVAGMVGGADSIVDMDLLRHGGMARLFTGVRAPSTLGTFLRASPFGHVRQLVVVAARFAGLARHAPIIGARVSRSPISTSTTRSGPPSVMPNKAPTRWAGNKP